MSVEFNDEKRPSILYARFQSSNEQPGLVRWLLSTGIVKTSDQANRVFIIVIIAALVVTGVILYATYGRGQSPLTPAQQQQIQQQLQSMHEGAAPTSS